MRIAGLVQDSIVDGPGFRFVVFTQGCKHHCPGCHNQKTHSFDAGIEMPVADIIEEMLGNPLTSGLTLSGGDPMEQADECYLLAQAAHEAGLNVWTYTGYTWEELMENGSEAQRRLLENSDVLVDGRYIESLRSLDLPFRGSRNQRLIDVSASLKSGTIVEFAM